MLAISDGFQNIAKEALNKPEIVELLLNNKLGTAGQTFKQKLESVLKRMPKIGTPSKSEYLPHFFRGAVFVLPQTDLMNKLDIENIYLQKVAIKYLQRQKTIHVAFQIEKDQQKTLKLYSFACTKNVNPEQHIHREHLQELINQPAPCKL